VTGELATRYLNAALTRAGIKKPFRPFHDRDLRHTSLTHAAAAGNPVGALIRSRCKSSCSDAAWDLAASITVKRLGGLR